jgi:transposase
LIRDTREPAELAELAQRSLRRKCPALAEALTGRVTAHHRFLLAQLLRHIECLDDAIATCDGHIETCTAAETDGVARLDPMLVGGRDKDHCTNGERGDGCKGRPRRT